MRKHRGLSSPDRRVTSARPMTSSVDRNARRTLLAWTSDLTRYGSRAGPFALRFTLSYYTGARRLRRSGGFIRAFGLRTLANEAHGDLRQAFVNLYIVKYPGSARFCFPAALRWPKLKTCSMTRSGPLNRRKWLRQVAMGVGSAAA